MNTIMNDYLPIFREYQAIRTALIEVLTNADLTVSLGGETMTLGALCREMGEVQQAYVEACRTFKLDFKMNQSDPTYANSITALRTWFAELDAQLEQAVSVWTDDDISNKKVDRGGGWMQPLPVALEVYKEALIIFYGKASIYLRAINKPRPQQMADWIA